MDRKEKNYAKEKGDSRHPLGLGLIHAAFVETILPV
jgi:hypothetical protein